MASAQMVKTSISNNCPSQDSNNPDDLFQSRYEVITPTFLSWPEIADTHAQIYTANESKYVSYSTLMNIQ